MIMPIEMPTDRYTIPTNEVLIGILGEIMPGVNVRVQGNSNGIYPEDLPLIFIRRARGASVGNSPSGKQTAVMWRYTFDCIGDSPESAELLGDWLYASLEKLVDPNVDGFNPVVFEDCWVTDVDEDELPDLSPGSGLEQLSLYLVRAAFAMTFRREV